MLVVVSHLRDLTIYSNGFQGHLFRHSSVTIASSVVDSRGLCRLDAQIDKVLKCEFGLYLWWAGDHSGGRGRGARARLQSGSAADYSQIQCEGV